MKGRKWDGGKKASGFEIGVWWKERKGHGGNNYSLLPISKQCPATTREAGPRYTQQCSGSEQLHNESPPAPSSPLPAWEGPLVRLGQLSWLSPWLVLPVLPMRSKRVPITGFYHLMKFSVLWSFGANIRLYLHLVLDGVSSTSWLSVRSGRCVCSCKEVGVHSREPWKSIN